jgi:rhomboid family GlyGly-CTERM serine protease
MKFKYPIEIVCFIALLAAFNLISPTDPLVLHLKPSALFDGELWRWFSFAWKHNSLYHLALDASAFVFLYQTLRCNLHARLAHLACCIVFSGLIPILLDPRLAEIGLAGLSGVAHGLMLLCAFEAAEQTDRRSRIAGVIIFFAVLLKTMFEQITGNVFFAGQHLGTVGVPIASCHFGGLVGAILSYILLTLLKARRNSSLNLPPLPASFDHAHLQTAASGAFDRQLQRHLHCRHAPAG